MRVGLPGRPGTLDVAAADRGTRVGPVARTAETTATSPGRPPRVRRTPAPGRHDPAYNFK